MAFSLEKIRLFLLDLDGTFYLDDTLLPGALAFLERCRERGILYQMPRIVSAATRNYSDRQLTFFN